MPAYIKILLYLNYYIFEIIIIIDFEINKRKKEKIQ